MPDHQKLQKELRELELNEEKAKVDPPPHGRKGLADALSGVIYGLTMRREIWFRHLQSAIEMHEFRKIYLVKPIKQNDFTTDVFNN